MLVHVWFDYWIGIKKQTVRLNTVRNYTEVEDPAENSGAFQHWIYDEPVCPYYRGRET